MKHTIILFVLFIAAACFAQPPDTLWTRNLGSLTTGTQEAWGVATSGDGSTWVAGFQQANPDPSAAVIYKLDLMGTVLDTFRLAGTDGFAFYAVASTSDGGCIATGKSILANAGGTTLLLVKLNSSGTAVWAQTYSDDVTRVGFAVQPTTDGGYVAAGRSRDANSLMRAFLLKTNATGVMQWSRTYGTTSNDQAYGVLQMPDGGYILTGATDSTTSNASAVLVVRTNAMGWALWRNAYRPGDYDEGHAIRPALGGGYAIGGWSRVASTYNNDMLLMKIDSAGVLQWHRHYGNSTIDIGWSLASAQDGGYILAGYNRAVSIPNAMILKTSPAGDSVWSRTFPWQRDSEFKTVTVSSDGGILAAGYRFSSGSASSYYVVRLAVPSGVAGSIHDELGHVVSGARVSAIGQPYWAMSNDSGHYTLALLPGTYDLFTFGPCTGRDTVRGITVDSGALATQNLSVGRTLGIVDQTSLNPVIHNHIPRPVTLLLRNRGAGVVDFSVICHPLHPATPWLSADPGWGSIAPGDSFPVRVWISADTNNAGIYDFIGQLDVHMNSCPDSLWNVSVIASVLDVPSTLSPYPLALSLSASPNPFNPSTEITFTLPKAAHVRLTIYDLTGREVQTLTDERYFAGEHRLVFDGSALPSGVYFARLTSTNITRTQKLLLLK